MVTFELRLEGGEGVSSAHVWGRAFQAGETARAKALCMECAWRSEIARSSCEGSEVKDR